MTVLDAIQPMKHQTVGHTIVRDIRVERQPDSSGEEAYFVVLVLADPPEGQDSWPLEDLRSLRQAVREAIAERVPDIDATWYVVFEPEHPDLEDDDEQLGFFDE
jgi:hypothetical protein